MAGFAGSSRLGWASVEVQVSNALQIITTNLSSSSVRDRNNENLQAQAGCPTGTCSHLGGLNRTAQAAQQSNAGLAQVDMQSPTASQGPRVSQSDTASEGPCAGQSTIFSNGSTVPSPKTFTAKATSYFPHNDPLLGGLKDRKEHPLHTLGQYLKGRAPYVLIAMDPTAFEYGQKLSIPELDAAFGKKIEFRVVDSGARFKRKGKSRLDICAETRADTENPLLNKTLTILPYD